MSICIACQAQLEGGGGSVCLPAYLSKGRTWLTLSGGVNSLHVINLALPVEAACHEHLPGPSLTPINMFTANAIWWLDSDKLPRMLCLIMPQNRRVYSHFGGLLLCKQGENIGLMFRRADDKEKPDRWPGQTSPLVVAWRELRWICFLPSPHFPEDAQSSSDFVDSHLKVSPCRTSQAWREICSERRCAIASPRCTAVSASACVKQEPACEASTSGSLPS